MGLKCNLTLLYFYISAFIVILIRVAYFYEMLPHSQTLEIFNECESCIS